MIPYKITFTTGDDAKDGFQFESNEKPFKAEIYSIQDADGKMWEAKVTEVTKTIIRSGKGDASIVYQCKVEKHVSPVTVSIGFGKRT